MPSDRDQLRQLQEATDRKLIEAAKRLKEVEKHAPRPLAYARRMRGMGPVYVYVDPSARLPGPTPAGLGDHVYTSDGWRRPTPTESHRVACGEEPW